MDDFYNDGSLIKKTISKGNSTAKPDKVYIINIIRSL